MTDLLANKEFLTILTILITTLGGIVKQHITAQKNNKKAVETAKKHKEEINKTVKEDVEKLLTGVDFKQNKQIAEISERLGVFENKFNFIADLIEIKSFREKFISNYKSKFRSYISQKDISDDLKTFLRAGIIELSILFNFMLLNNFKCEISDFKSELENSEISLKTKFKNKSTILKKHEKIIRQEIEYFEFEISELKKSEKTNGKRMSAFKRICEKTTINVINKLSNGE